MNKKEFIAYTSERSGVPRYRLTDALDAITESTAAALEEGESVKLHGFGEFTVRQRKASKGRDPRSGEMFDIPSKKKPYFKPGITLVEAVERGKDNWPDREDAE